MLKVALNFGSSQHGNTRRAPIGWKCVAINDLSTRILINV